MKRSYFRIFGITLGLLLILVPTLPLAAENPPPVAATLVREGAFAEKLAEAFELGAGSDEILAESRLGEIGVSPRNGWIADYPVTPDILGEIQQSIIESADSSRLRMSREDALNIFYDINMSMGLAVIPDADESIRQSSSEDYPPPNVVNNYYYNYGPPVVTYYAPPPGYVYLYGWVPFPFWYSGFWFPGFYVLNDFHMSVFVGSRTCFVSNHYHDLRYHRSYVVNPVHRFHGGTVYGVGAQRGMHTVYRGNPRVAHEVLNSSRDRMMRAGTARPAYTGRNAAPARDNRVGKQGPANKRMAAPYQGRSAVKATQDGRVIAQPRPITKSVALSPQKTAGQPVRYKKAVAQPRPATRDASLSQGKRPGQSVRERKAAVQPQPKKSAPQVPGVNPTGGAARFQNGAGHAQPAAAQANGRISSQPNNIKAMAPRYSTERGGQAFRPAQQNNGGSGFRSSPGRGGGPERGNAERGGRGSRG